MAERVVLHVGAMKSGTSFVQSGIFASKDPLAEQGVLVPGKTWSDQVNGTLDVLGRLLNKRKDVSGSWRALLDEVEPWPGTAVISMEFLGPISPEKIAVVVDSLRPARVSVVLTARDLNRSLAAMWQETVQNGRWWTWADYLRGAERARPRPDRTPDDITEAGRTFWKQQNTVRLSRHWMGAADDYTFITLPGPGGSPDALAERFAAAVGFDHTTLAPGQPANTSIDAAAAEVLRRMNGLLAARDLEFPIGAWLRKQRLAKTVLASRHHPELRIGLPVADWVVGHAAVMVGQLQRLGVDLIGDWGDLDPVPVPGIDPGAVTEEDVRAAARDALAGITPALEGRAGADWRSAAVGETSDALIAHLADGVARAIRDEAA